MKSRRAVLTWILVGAVTVGLGWYFLRVRRSERSVTLEFVRHAKVGPTQVAIFRLKSYRGFRGEMDGEGEIVEEHACYAARWLPEVARPRSVVGGEHEFAVIEPHKGPWQLRLTFYRPGESRDGLPVKLRATWYVLRHQPLRSRAVIGGIWGRTPPFSAAAFEAQMIMNSVYHRVPLRIVTATVTGEPVPEDPSTAVSNQRGEGH
jgi:hypothetical protein